MNPGSENIYIHIYLVYLHKFIKFSHLNITHINIYHTLRSRKKRRTTAMSNFTQNKSSFAKKCNLLSQYIKEKGSFGDISFDVNGNITRDQSAVITRSQNPASNTEKLLPNLENRSSENPDFRANNDEPATATKDNQNERTSQMTIFYAGNVLVFDAFSSEKYKEIVALAKTANTKPADSGDKNGKKYNSSRIGTLDLNIAASTSGNSDVDSIDTKENSGQDQHSEALGSDLPIARRASLHRFLEKRKDRVTARAPYPVNQRPPKPEERNPRPVLEGQSSKQQLDLNRSQ